MFLNLKKNVKYVFSNSGLKERRELPPFSGCRDEAPA